MWIGTEATSPGATSTWPSSRVGPNSRRQRPLWTTKTSAVSWLCCEFRQPAGWRAAPMLKPWGSAMWTCWSGLSDTPGPMIVKFSFRSEPGVRVSTKAFLQGTRSA